MSQSKGFFESLFDLSFSSFITTKLIKLLYILGMVGIGVVTLIMAGSGFASGIMQGLLMLLLAPVFFLLYVMFLRVWLELVCVIFRIAEDVHTLARQKEGSAPLEDSLSQR